MRASGRIVTVGRAYVTHRMGRLVGPRASTDVLKHAKLSCSCQESQPNSLVARPAAIILSFRPLECLRWRLGFRKIWEYLWEGGKYSRTTQLLEKIFILIWNYMFRPIMAIFRFLYRLRGVYISEWGCWCRDLYASIPCALLSSANSYVQLNN